MLQKYAGVSLNDRNMDEAKQPTETSSTRNNRQKPAAPWRADRNREPAIYPTEIEYTKRGHPESRASSKIFT